MQRLRDLGFTEVPSAAEVGAAVVLGGVDVSPLELGRAYTALLNAGHMVALQRYPQAPADDSEPASAGDAGASGAMPGGMLVDEGPGAMPPKVGSSLSRSRMSRSAGGSASRRRR